MLIAVTADKRELTAQVPESYEESRCLLLVETDDDTVQAAYDAADPEGLFFAEQTIAHDCEAIVCGKMRKPGFEAIASNNITRYYGAGLPVLEAAHAAEDNHLPLTTDYIGGSGCGSHERDRCKDHMEGMGD